MVLGSGSRRGNTWSDANMIHSIIEEYPFQQTGKTEGAFENGFASVLMVKNKDFKQQLNTQKDKSTKVGSVYCLGKKHRPDCDLDNGIDPKEYGIAIELKYFTYDNFKKAIGQSMIYKLQYKFVFLILIMSEKCKDNYYEIENDQDQNLNTICNYLMENNIFAYFVPSFLIKKPGVRKCISFFPERSK